MKNIPTAEEMFDSNPILPPGIQRQACIAFMKAFAKLHVDAALESAHKSHKVELFVRPNRRGSKYKLVKPGESYDIFGTRQLWKVNKESILNAYSLENIK
jgi:hypothetical protein